ncbi:MAG: hypothetical protein IJK84_02630 [Bacteroidales bacterium]|nr:hypothetical protein [Bacteroidales bacterium]
MKKHFFFFTLLLVAGIASAQQIRYIYRPGEGERQMGVILGPTIGSQSLLVKVDDNDQYIDNLIGYTAGIFWGYETDHGRAIDFGNHASLLYTLQPFSGKLNYFDGTTTTRVGFNGQQIRFYENPFLSYRATQQLIINAGVGIGLNAGLPSKYHRDGETFKAQYNLLTQLFFDFDANVGARYYITDDLFVGAHVHWAFYTFDIRDLAESDMSKELVGGISFVAEDGPNAVYMPSTKPFQVLFSFGHTW